MAEVPLAIRVAARALARRPLQPLIAAVVLGVAVGAAGIAATATYDSVLRPSPYRGTDRVLTIRDASDLLSPSALATLRTATSFDALSAYAERRFTFRDGASTRNVAALEIDSLFTTLVGVRPRVGRSFDAADQLPSAAPVAIVRDGLVALGDRIVLDGEAFTVVGVMPRGVRFPGQTEVWVPRRGAASSELEQFTALARLARGVTAARASVELSVLAQRRNAERPSTARRVGYHSDEFEKIARGGVPQSFWLTVASAALLVLLTAGTLANLFLVRAVARTHDVAVRAALGASPVELVKQHLAEATIVALAGAMIGVVIALCAAPVLPLDVAIDWRVLSAIALAALFFAALLGVAPGVRFRGRNLIALLRGGADGITAGAGQRRWRGTLVAAELSLVMFLVIAAGVLSKVYFASERIEWGYDTRNTLFGIVSLPQSRFDDVSARTQLAEALRTRLQSAGVGRATVFAESYPMWVPGNVTRWFEAEGATRMFREGSDGPHTTVDTDSSFLSTMGLRLLRGRFIAPEDRAGAEPVIVIDQRLAERNWPGIDPVGHHIKLVGMEPNGPWYRIVGLVGNVAEISFSSAILRSLPVKTSVAYRSLAQSAVLWPGNGQPTRPGFAFAIHASSGGSAPLRAARAALADVAPDQPIEQLGSLQNYLNARGAAVRDTAKAMSVIGIFGIVLCVLGVVGLVADTVVRRTREIGIRVTLGARTSDILAIVLDESTKLACVGVALGLVVSGVLVKVLGHYIPALGLNIDDPWLVVTAAFAVLLLVVASTLWPASKALRVAPSIALKAD
jgi:putative ABC transport system permease protein